MAPDLLEERRTIDPALLTAVVRQDQRSPTFALLDWSVARLSDKGIINPDGLFRLSGQGRDNAGTRPWSVVIKTLKASEQPQEPTSLWYWKREALRAQSDLPPAFPGFLVAPRFYSVREEADGVWVWMELITDAVAAAWRLEHYAFAADQIGRFNAAYATGAPLPDAPWLCRDHARGWTEGLSPENAWENPYVQRHFSASLQTRILQLWAERERFYAALAQGPQIFSHFDCQRRNLIIRSRPGGRQELVAVDWGLCGLGPLGGDLMALIGSSVALYEWEPARLAELEAAVFDAYLTGLRAGGWRGDPRLPRLGYAAWIALHWGAALPAASAFWLTEPMIPQAIRQFGHSPEALASGWAALCNFSLNRGDEARRLMDEL